MDLSALLDKAPELLIGFGMIAAVAWFRKQDRQQMATMRAEVHSVRMSALPVGDDVEATTTGPYRAVVVPWERLGERFDELAEKVDDEIVESRKFREATGQRVTALETDVRWLRRGESTHADTRDDRKG